MNKCPKIKICGIRSPRLARSAALDGADYIGLIFHQSSQRAVSVAQAIIIAEQVRTYGAIPVAVFVDQTAQQMLDICLATQIITVQLHGASARQAHGDLGSKYQRFYVRSVSTQGVLLPDKEQGLCYCDAKRDYVLFDHTEPGKGISFDWNRFQNEERGVFPMIFSGGLRVENVGRVIQQFQPEMVDVSSGVEDNSGEKSSDLIAQFIQTVRGIL